MGTAYTLKAHTYTPVNGENLPCIQCYVSFNVVSGPDTGLMEFDFADNNGNVFLKYTNNDTLGTDTISVT